MATMKEWAYLYKKEPDKFEYYMQKIRETEIMIKNKGKSWQFKSMGVEEFERRIKNKWIKKLENEQKNS